MDLAQHPSEGVMWIKWRRPCRSAASISNPYFRLPAESPRLRGGLAAIFVLPSPMMLPY
jgi:hypothetical protein